MQWRPKSTGVEERAWFLLWLGLVAFHVVLAGPVLSGPAFSGGTMEPVILSEGLALDPLVKVDLRVDPLQKLLLVSGIGPGLAGKIIEARNELKLKRLQPFQCRCSVMRIPGVPDRALLEAGPWLLPLPCPGQQCLYPSAPFEAAPSSVGINR
ncbi:MAG: hypothetical protein CBC13_07500 [Planctomycetia bacterium TMED53]|nr:MAG: hypothetical protein CBC13_07500 [Planctomycetia bacterium TMED53]